MTWARAGQVTGEPNDVAEFDVDLSAGNATPTVSSDQAMTGIYSIRHGFGITQFYPSGLTFAAAVCARVSFWFRHNAVGANDACIVKMRSTTTLAEVRMTSIGNVLLYVGGTLVLTKTAAECGLDSLGTWQHLALTYYAHASTGYVTFYVDGVSAMAYTGAVVGSPTSAYVGGSGSGSSRWAASAYYDDLYVDTSSAAEADACPDALRFVPKLVNGTTSTEWTLTGAASETAALATNDGDTSYLLSIVANDLFVGTLSDATIPAEHTAVAVHTFDVAKRGDAASTVKTSLIAGINTATSAEMLPGTSYGRQVAQFLLAPDGLAWDNTKVNAISLGVESAGSFV